MTSTPPWVHMRNWIEAHRTIEYLEGAPMFMGIPDRWYEDPHWRCENGHVSSTYLKSEEEGNLCLAAGCRKHVMMTFPEDTETDPPTPLGPKT